MNEGGWKETGSNPKIKFLWDEIGYNGSQYADRTAWCAVFAGAVLKRSGNKYIQTASSQAYSQYGTEVATAQGDKIDLTNLKREIYWYFKEVVQRKEQDTLRLLQVNLQIHI